MWNDIVDDTYNSGTLNLGLTFDKYFGIEGFYQNSTEKEGAYSSLKTNFPPISVINYWLSLLYLQIFIPLWLKICRLFY